MRRNWHIVFLTCRPQEIDEAARRRLVKRLYIPLPDAGAREQIMCSLLAQQKCSLSQQNIIKIVQQTHGMCVLIARLKYAMLACVLQGFLLFSILLFPASCFCKRQLMQALSIVSLL